MLNYLLGLITNRVSENPSLDKLIIGSILVCSLLLLSYLMREYWKTHLTNLSLRFRVHFYNPPIINRSIETRQIKRLLLDIFVEDKEHFQTLSLYGDSGVGKSLLSTIVTGISKIFETEYKYFAVDNFTIPRFLESIDIYPETKNLNISILSTSIFNSLATKSIIVMDFDDCVEINNRLNDLITELKILYNKGNGQKKLFVIYVHKNIQAVSSDRKIHCEPLNYAHQKKVIQKFNSKIERERIDTILSEANGDLNKAKFLSLFYINRSSSESLNELNLLNSLTSDEKRLLWFLASLLYSVDIENIEYEYEFLFNMAKELSITISAIKKFNGWLLKKRLKNVYVLQKIINKIRTFAPEDEIKSISEEIVDFYKKTPGYIRPSNFIEILLSTQNKELIFQHLEDPEENLQINFGSSYRIKAIKFCSQNHIKDEYLKSIILQHFAINGAFEFLEISRKILNSLKRVHGKTDHFWVNLGNSYFYEYMFIREEEKKQRALFFYKKSEDILLKSPSDNNSQKSLFKTYLSIAMLYYTNSKTLNEVATSIKYCHMAEDELSKFSKKENTKERAFLYKHLGNAYQERASHIKNLNSYVESVKYYLKSLRISEENNFQNLRRMAYTNLGNNFIHQSEYVTEEHRVELILKSIEWFRKALLITPKVLNSLHFANLSLSLAHTLYTYSFMTPDRNDLMKEAISLVNESIDIFSLYSLNSSLNLSYLLLSQLLFHTSITENNMLSSKEDIETSIALSENLIESTSNNDSKAQFLLSFNLSTSYGILGDITKKTKYYDSSLDVLSDLDNTSLITLIPANKGVLLYSKANIHLKKYSLNNDPNHLKIAKKYFLEARDIFNIYRNSNMILLDAENQPLGEHQIEKGLSIINEMGICN